MQLELGDVLGGYRVIRPLGEGGMGAVYEVEHLKLGVHYALKTFVLGSGEIELFRQRFVAEGKVLARLRHPNIARVFDLNYDDRSGSVYFVMDLIHYKDNESYSLADLEVGGADEEHLIRWFGQLASAIDYIHAKGIVHRDIKLNNILLNDTGGVVLSDFGISRFVGDRMRRQVDVERTIVSMGARQTTGNLIMGTAGYMAPELLQGVSATPVADTYALGISFFRLLTGIWYETGTKAIQLLEPFQAGWQEIVPQMLSADPDQRPVRLMPLAERLNESYANCVLPTVHTKRHEPMQPVRRWWLKCAWSAGGAVLLGLVLGLKSCLSAKEADSASEDSCYDHLYDVPECLL